MSARGRKAQLIPTGVAIASELGQEFRSSFEDRGELDQYFGNGDDVEPYEIENIFLMENYLQRMARLQAVG